MIEKVAGNNMNKKAGMVAYWVGIMGAILIGILSGFGAFQLNSTLVTILVVAGLVIGFFNIKRSESQIFLVSTLFLVIFTSGLALIPFVSGFLKEIGSALTLVLLPAGIVVAGRNIFKTGR